MPVLSGGVAADARGSDARRPHLPAAAAGAAGQAVPRRHQHARPNGQGRLYAGRAVPERAVHVQPAH